MSLQRVIRGSRHLRILTVCAVILTMGAVAAPSAAESGVPQIGADGLWNRTIISKIPDHPSVKPDIAAKGPMVHVVWEEGYDGNIFYRRSLDGGATWQPRKRLEGRNSVDARRPSVVLWGSTVVVAWQDDRTGSEQIYMRRSADGGATWSGATRVSGNRGSSSGVDLARGGGALQMVYSSDKQGNMEVYHRRSTNGGATWSRAVRVTRNQGPSADPKLVADGQSMTIAFAQYNNAWDKSQVYVVNSTDDGATWGTPTNLSRNPDLSEIPVLAIVGKARVLVWTDILGDRQRIVRVRSIDGGATWSNKRVVSDPARQAVGWGLAVSGNQVLLATHEYDNVSLEVYLHQSSDKGRTWTETGRVSRPDDYSARPSIAVAWGITHIVYEDDYPVGDYMSEIVYATPITMIEPPAP